jgi:D-sedoheptulose 7-phosphate isomerase
MKKEISDQINLSSEIIKNLNGISDEIEKAINLIVSCLNNKHKIILFGNGGSAADAQHIAAEFIGRYKLERKSYPAIALTSNSSTLTAISNDYSYETVFSRQCESLVSSGDIVIGISTSGNSKNVIEGILKSKKNGAITIGLVGNGGGEISKIVDAPLIIKSNNTPHIQEAHRVLYHIICDIVEKKVSKEIE